MKRIVIYGGEMSGVCAAIRAAELISEEHTITIINPNVSSKLGGIATAGGLNCWDLGRYYYRDQSGNETWKYDNETGDRKRVRKILNYGGMFQYIFDNVTPQQNYKIEKGVSAFSSDDPDLGDYLNEKVASLGINVLFKMDIWDVDYSLNNNKKTIETIYLKSIRRDSKGRIIWGRKTKKITADFFIDASDDGKLTSFLTKVSVGRFDWPATYLEPVETEDQTTFVARQQSATLYFKLKNLRFDSDTNSFSSEDREHTSISCTKNDQDNYDDPNNDIMQYNYSKNNSSNKEDVMIKEYNMARNGYGDKRTEWCANTMLIFKVDGRANHRDTITKFYPKKMISDTIDRDEAWIKGRETIKGVNNDFLNGVRGFGYRVGSNAIFDSEDTGQFIGDPVVADSLYIRETVHLVNSSNAIENGSEDDNYAITPQETFYAGYKRAVNDSGNIIYDGGMDWDNYEHRIGIGVYSADIHPYVVSDMLVISSNSASPTEDSHIILRPDYFDSLIEYSGNAFYIPYETIYANEVNNLLVAGHASNVCGFSWGEVRLLPNLSVIGDSAGLILAYCINYSNNNNPINFSNITNYFDTGFVDGDNNIIPSVHEAMENPALMNGSLPVSEIKPIKIEKPWDIDNNSI